MELFCASKVSACAEKQFQGWKCCCWVRCRPPQDSPATLNTQLYMQLYEKKLARFRQFAALYPECYWLFVGDNGQVCWLRSCSVPT
jgi:hypothetical protein